MRIPYVLIRDANLFWSLNRISLNHILAYTLQPRSRCEDRLADALRSTRLGCCRAQSDANATCDCKCREGDFMCDNMDCKPVAPSPSPGSGFEYR